MNQLYYFHSLRKTTIQVLNLFNELKIAKYKNDGTIAKVIPVPLKLVPKEKFTYWLYHRKNFEKRLPMMGLTLSNMTPATERMVNNATPITYALDDEWLKHLNPMPVNLSYKLTLATQYMVEMDQMLEQIVPFFDPYVMTRVSLPEFNNFYNVKVIMNSVNQSTTPDTPQDDYRMVVWEIDLTAETYLFKPTRNSGIIEKIIERFYTDEKSFAAMQKQEAEAPKNVTVANFTTAIDAVTGKVSISMPASETSKITTDDCQWELVLTSPTGEVTSCVSGKVIKG